MNVDKALWYAKQLLPLMYRTTYGEDGKWYATTWRMRFGRCYAIERYEIVR